MRTASTRAQRHEKRNLDFHHWSSHYCDFRSLLWVAANPGTSLIAATDLPLIDFYHLRSKREGPSVKAKPTRFSVRSISD